MGMAASMGISTNSGRNYGLDDPEIQVVRYKPEGLDSLCQSTKFTRKELQVMYRGFKQECPTGIVNEDTFKYIYAQFFPQGDSSSYAHYVFKMFDIQQNGTISFEDFVTSLSVLARGTIDEKLRWTFALYDLNGDGVVSRSELTTIVSAIYSIMGKYAEPSINNDTVRSHVDRIFQIMDKNQDGVISVDEFMETCMQDDAIIDGVMALDTSFCS